MIIGYIVYSKPSLALPDSAILPFGFHNIYNHFLFLPNLHVFLYKLSKIYFSFCAKEKENNHFID